MRMTVSDRCRAFRALHEAGCFVLPNPWDIGSARLLAAMGFAALASTSSGAAAALGRQDGDLSLDEVLAHLRLLVDATDLPVNADFEAGFADAPDDIARHVSRAIETGVAGLSIEDRKGAGLYDGELAVARIRAARQAIDRSGQDVVLVARTEGFLIGRTQLSDTVDRLVAMAEAGADCLYAPGVGDLAAIRAIVAAVAPKPVNALLVPGLSVRDLAQAGVRRVSTGGALARAAQAALEVACRRLLDDLATATGAVPPGGGGALRLGATTALLVIDVQQGFDEPRWGPRNNPAAEGNIARLLDGWRGAGMPVLHVHHDSAAPDGAFRPGTPGNRPKQETAPRPGEPVYRKTVNSAFIGTGLQDDLRRRGIPALVIVGLTTNHCVSTTARMAGNLGIDTVVVADATATFDRATPSGHMRLADAVHEAALGDLDGEFATVARTDAILEAISRIDTGAVGATA